MSRQFKLGNKTASDYFRFLDTDGDNLISFSEFLSPLLEKIPPKVAIVFISDVRFKIEILQNIREAIRFCAKISSLLTFDLVKSKLLERKDSLA